MKPIIIYKGKYGATRQYAEWLSEAVTAPMVDADEMPVAQMNDYDLFIIGSSVYVGKLLIRRWLSMNADLLSRKKCCFFIVCATPDSEREKQRQISRYNIPQQLLDDGKIFFLPGRLNIKRLSWKHRVLLKLGAWLEKDPIRKAAMKKDIDDVKKEHLKRLLIEIKAAKGVSNKVI